MEVIYTVAVFAVLVIGILIKMHFDEKKGVDSEEKRKVAEIVKRIVPAGEEYTAAYAYWARNMRYSKTCWFYAIGFNAERIYLAPLSIANGVISYAKPFVIEKSRLGIVNGSGNKEKAVWAAFYNEEQNHILSLWVRESNTKDSKCYPVNIQQKEETVKFAELINRWMDEVNTAHGVTASGKLTGSPIKNKR